MQGNVDEVSWHLVEIEVVKRYLSWITKQKDAYTTKLQQDKDLLELVTELTPKGRFHWMY